MKNVILKNITDKADRAANNWNKTRDPKYKEEWYRLIRSLAGAYNKTSRDSNVCSPLQVPTFQSS